MSEQIDWRSLCEPVARIVWGEPSQETADQLEWGERGSKTLSRSKGVWHDFERNVGGGALDLVPCADVAGRMRWLADHGLIERQRSNGAGGKSFSIVATYDYTDESGALLFQVVRYVPKDFRQRRPDGKGGWIWGLGDTRRLLYRLPQLLEATANERPIFVTEGEKDVDNLRGLGVAATCNPGGANKWRDEYSETLRDADVLIICDNDQPGRDHAEHVAAALHGIARRVRVLDLARAWPTCPIKGDISNWIEAGGAADTLAAMVELLPDWEADRSKLARRPIRATINTAEGISNPLDDLVERSTADPGSPFEAPTIAALAKLRTTNLAEYEVLRAALKAAGVRVSVLDQCIKQHSQTGDNVKQGRALQLPEPQPWPDAVDGAALLTDLADAIRRYVVMSDHAATAAALWVVHTYMLAEAIDISPRLAVTSPERGCGKTTLLDVLTRLVKRPLPAANATSSAIFRVVEMQQPTLLIDEADTFLAASDDLRGILNSGHRRGGAVLRTVGDDHEPRQFSTYSACAIALIGRLPGTLADRSVPITLKRRRADEQITQFRSDRTGHLVELARRVARWAADHVHAVRGADPAMPDGVRQSFGRQLASAAGYRQRRRRRVARSSAVGLRSARRRYRGRPVGRRAGAHRHLRHVRGARRRSDHIDPDGNRLGCNRRATLGRVEGRQAAQHQRPCPTVAPVLHRAGGDQDRDRHPQGLHARPV